MTSKSEDEISRETGLYLLLDQITEESQGDLGKASLSEMAEIEEIRRIVADISDERPIFMTST